jgi:hypothetical protein
MFALIRRHFPRPHPKRDLQRFLEALEALPSRREWHSKSDRFSFVPCRADSKVRSTPGKNIEGGDRFEENPRMAINDSGHKSPKAHATGYGCQETESAVTFEHRFVRFSERLDLEEVIHDPNARETSVIGSLADTDK